MLCNFNELRSKEVVDMNTGERLGYIDDVRFDTASGEVRAVLIYGSSGVFGLWGRGDDIEIPCGDIRVVGSDIILVDRGNRTIATKNAGKSFESLFD